MTQGLAPDAVVSEALPVEPIDDEVFPQLAPVSADETETLSGDERPAPEPEARDTRPPRTGRTRVPRALPGERADRPVAPLRRAARQLALRCRRNGLR